MNEKGLEQHSKYRHMYANWTLKDPVWYCVFDDLPGRPKRSTGISCVEYKNIREALAEAVKIKSELEKLENPKENRIKKGETNPLIVSLFEDFKEEKAEENLPQTMKRYDNVWEYRLKWFWGALHLEDFKQSTVKKFERKYLSKFEGTTYRNTGKTLSSFARWLNEEKWLGEVIKFKNLDPILAKRSKKEAVGRVYTKHEVKRMIAVIDGKLTEFADDPVKFFRWKKAQVIFLLGRFMGLRKNEALRLHRTWLYLDYDDEADQEFYKLKIWSSKNGKYRYVRVPDIVLGPMQELLEIHDSKYMVPAARDYSKPMEPQVFDKDWVIIKKEAKISDWDVPLRARFHDLRDTMATDTSIERWPVKEACYVLDMSEKTYYKYYVHSQKGTRDSLMQGVGRDF